MLYLLGKVLFEKWFFSDDFVPFGVKLGAQWDKIISHNKIHKNEKSFLLRDNNGNLLPSGNGWTYSLSTGQQNMSSVSMILHQTTVVTANVTSSGCLHSNIIKITGRK
jgi:hypothetical protein